MQKLLLAPFFVSVLAAQQPSTRDMAEINWMEFHEWVPLKITTVLLPTGTLEAHGVENNGADITAPVEIARRMTARVNAMIATGGPLWRNWQPGRLRWCLLDQR